MKKTIIALMGLFTLVACSDEVIQDVDKKNENGVLNSDYANLGDKVAYTYSDPGFDSPYEELRFGTAISYEILNSTSLTYEITPIIGLTYYDGFDDGFYNNPKLFTPIDLTSGNYPNLYAGGIEYLNLIKGPTITINPLVSGMIANSNHCPVLPGEPFDLAPQGATVEEVDLLSKAGKVYYFDIIVKNGTSTVATGKVKQMFHNIYSATPLNSFGDWNYLGFIIPPYVEMYYWNQKSKEIATGNHFVPNAVPNIFTYVDPLTGIQGNIHYETGGGYITLHLD